MKKIFDAYAEGWTELKRVKKWKFIVILLLTFGVVTCNKVLESSNKKEREKMFSEGYLVLSEIGNYGTYKTCYYANENGKLSYSYNIYPTYNPDGSVKRDGKGGYEFRYCESKVKPF
jgi:hypothetical protein